jgi:hypothetical protein
MLQPSLALGAMVGEEVGDGGKFWVAGFRAGKLGDYGAEVLGFRWS